MTETGWLVVFTLGLMAMFFTYLGWVEWVRRKYPRPSSRTSSLIPSRRSSSVPMWTSSSTTVTYKKPDDATEKPKDE